MQIISQNGQDYGTVAIESGAYFAHANGWDCKLKFPTPLAARNYVLRKGEPKPMNPTTQKLLDASESLASPMHSTNQASQHTPGPWSLENGRHMIGEGPDGKPVFGTSVGPYRTREVIEANARHIVHCVNSHAELLAALENLLAGPNWPGAQMTARAAIARAKGGAA